MDFKPTKMSVKVNFSKPLDISTQNDDVIAV
jgi:hypothetical protein